MIEKFKLYENNNSEKLLNQLKKSIVPKVQKVYNEWNQNEEGYDEMLGYGGICQDIAGAIADVISDSSIECSTVSSSHEVHVYVVAKMEDGVYNIDISPYTYETGGGYTWKKIPDVEFDERDIIVNRLDSDKNNYSTYIDENCSTELFEKLSVLTNRVFEADVPEITILKGKNQAQAQPQAQPKPQAQVQPQTQVQPQVQIQNSGQTSNSGQTATSGQTQVEDEQKPLVQPVKKIEPKDIIVKVENRDDKIITKLIDGLSLVVHKRNIKNLRIVTIDGILNKLDISTFKYSKLKVVMSNGDIIDCEYTLNNNNMPNIKVSINETLVFDLDHKTYTLELSIDKLIDNYRKYLQSKNWKIK